jgi:hypothetical protein
MQDLNDKITGGTLTALEWNEVPSEIQNVIEGLGITLSSGDLNQLGKAIAGYVANGTFYTDSGAADAYVLTTIGSKQALTAYTDGAVFDFIAANPGTGGAATVNVAAIGPKNIKLADGNDPAAGQIDGRVTLKFDLANNRCELIQTGQVKVTIVTVSDAAFTPSPGVKSIEFTVIGGGGGGGGVDGQGAGTSGISSAGSGGGTSIKTTFAINATYNITIGAGGPGGAAGNNNGTVGGNTTVVSVSLSLTGNGGGAGVGNTATAGNVVLTGITGGTSSGGDLNIQGSDSDLISVVNGEVGGASVSGSSIFGGGLRTRFLNTGFNGVSPGSGGGGTSVGDVVTNFAGGDGADGIVVVKEFF